MRFPSHTLKHRDPWPFLFPSLAAIGVFLVLLLSTSKVEAGKTIATYSQGTLRVTIPYNVDHAGSGQLTIDLLDPDDNPIAHATRRVAVSQGSGSWREEVKLDKPLALEDLVWHRLRYRFEYSDTSAGADEESLAGTESISQIIRTPVVHILGQQSYLSGGPAAVRVIVTDSKNDALSGGGSVRIELLNDGQKPRLLYTGRLNHRGTTEAQFRFPAGLTGSQQLRYSVDTSIGATDFTQAVRLDDKVSILLTTEKPIYQPGQTIHVRALALDRASHEATANRGLTFEVEDSRANKVFRKSVTTDKFGVAFAEFSLADEVNLGTYHLRAILGDPNGSTANTAEIALNVERYVLPKFKVAVDFSSKEHSTKRGYRPGDHVTGTVHANYFFGKSVDLAEVTVKASSMDVSLFEAAHAEGKTDSQGDFHFDLTLPEYFAGRPLSQGAARVLIEATVKDSASHSETRGEPITVSESPFLIIAVPEGGTLVPNLENQVFVLASYPDGSPAHADLTVRASGSPDQRVSTDDGGVAVIRVNAGSESSQKLEVEASDKEGNRASTTISLQSRQGLDQILLRTERAVYRAGERISLRVFSTKSRGSAYVDIVKDGQTILTRDIDFENGQAELTLAATPEMAGTLDINAYLFSRDSRPVADHRLVFVQPADELKIESSSDRPVYKPGDDARVHFRVTNSRGQGVSAALGVQVVDEAVFALAEKQPGFAKVFFYLEQEVLKPRYEIHSIGLPEVVASGDDSETAQRDRAARALFSATEMANPNKFETEFGRTIPSTKYAEYAARYQARLATQLRHVSEALARAYSQHHESHDVPALFQSLVDDGAPEFRDPWGTKFRIQRNGGDSQRAYYLVTSAGPDKQFGTGDDFSSYLTVTHKKRVGRPSSGPSIIEVDIESDRGPDNGHAEIVGTAIDQWGAALQHDTIALRVLPGGMQHSAIVNSEGHFRFSGLPAGEYQIQIFDASGTLSRTFTLNPRDRAVLSIHLRQKEEDSLVSFDDSAITLFDEKDVNEIRPRVFLKEAGERVVGGVAGGVMGGVIAQNQAVPAPAAPKAMLLDRESVSVDSASTLVVNTSTAAKEDSAAPRVRSYFPEALYINPEIITDSDGRASISIPLADSITTWRMAMFASTAKGALGSSSSSLKVFQDFFVDLDLPVTLTQGDRVSLPVAVYNYSGSRGDVRLKLQPEDWFSLLDDSAEKDVSVDSERVGGSQFTIEARRIGKFKLTLSASMNGSANRADIVVREIEVIPNGREQNFVFNGRLDSSAQQTIDFPADAIPEASKIFLRLYPGPLSQVVEGMDSLLAMPFGCFEQTSSSTYPNVLALDYMKRTKKLTPEIHAKAEGFIANGYQRLLTFEVPGGGFSWFGNPPANKILTAYGLMEFFDMSKVYDVDPRLISRTQQWLASQQQPDGSWKPDTSFINEGATNRYNSDLLRITAYLAWSLENTGYQGPAIEKARQFIESHMSGKVDPYTLAVVANFAADYNGGKDREFAHRAIQLLLDARIEKGEEAWWTSEETGVYSTGLSASIETTGLAVQALLKSGEASAVARKAMAYIAAKKGASGAWGTTQATIMALRALLLATEKGSADVRGNVEVLLNGKPSAKLTLTPENNDLLHQFVFKNLDAKGANEVELRFAGKGGLAYQIVGAYFLPWDKKIDDEPLSIDVAYDRTRLAQDDVATATATIRNNLSKTANMVMVDLGIPPGFDLLSEDLQSYLEKSRGLKSGRLEKFSLTATQAILYFDSFAPGDKMTLSFRLRAKYPIRAKTFQSRVYEYYDPDVHSVARPIQLEVRPR